MPGICQAQCTTCGRGPDVKSFLADEERSGRGKEGLILSSDRRAVQFDNGKFEILPHPGELGALYGRGFTWFGAMRQNRLFEISYKICKNCGCLHEERQHTSGHWGCLFAIVLALLIIIVLKFVAQLSWGKSLIGGFVGAFALCLLAIVINDLRWRRRNFDLAVHFCPNCTGNELVTLSSATTKPQMCPHCHTQTMLYKWVGIS